MIQTIDQKLMDNQAPRPRVIIIGGGFAGLKAAKTLGLDGRFDITIIDKNNYHLFQPLLYQVATGGLSPTEIAVPIRSILSKYDHITVFLGTVESIDLKARRVKTDDCEFGYDYLILACGSQHSYFGHSSWSQNAPGLKTIEHGIEIRKRVLYALEKAECEHEPGRRLQYLTMVVIGGGPTGVELAGALAELTRFTLRKEFRNIHPEQTRIILVEASKRLLPSFDPHLANQAVIDLEALGVEVRTGNPVTNITPDAVLLNDDPIPTRTVLWAAGVQASPLNQILNFELDAAGRIKVNQNLSVLKYANVFVAGDQAGYTDGKGSPLPGTAPVAAQMGAHAAHNIICDLNNEVRKNFKYKDKGQLATIGRNRAIYQGRHFKLHGRVAWWLWLLTHIYYLIGFKNRVFVLFDWGWSYLTFTRGSRLITSMLKPHDIESEKN